MGSTVLAVLAFGVGALMVVATVLSAIMTLVVPRALPVRITRLVFTGMRALFRLRGSRARSFEARDRDLALYGPISLFILAATWLVLTCTGYMLMFWALGERPLRQALVLSGSSIYTLGFEVPANLPTTVLAFGWRVNNDRALLSLAALTMAPYAPWSSDRSMIERNGSRIRRHNRSRA